MNNLNIPIYRAKKIDSDECVQGFLFKDTDGYFRITNGIKDYKHPLKLPFEYLIDSTTLEISFNNSKSWKTIEEVQTALGIQK